MDILLNVLLDAETDAYLRQLAKETERSRGAVVRFLIRQYALAHGRPDIGRPSIRPARDQPGGDPDHDPAAIRNLQSAIDNLQSRKGTP